MRFLLLVVLAPLSLFVIPETSAKTFTVHWGFNTRPSKIRVSVKDKVRFIWSGITHSIDLFHSRSDYATCSLQAHTTNVVSPRANGNVVFSAKRWGVGKHLFACKVAYPSHCLGGVKIEIDVCKKC